jgi:hypothetical protein
MASRVKDIRKIGSSLNRDVLDLESRVLSNKGRALNRPQTAAGVIAPEFLLGTRGAVSVDENGVVSRKVASRGASASFEGFSLSDLGQRIEEQRRELARERQHTFGGILSDVQGLSNSLLMERNKAESDRLRSIELEQRNGDLEAALSALRLENQQLRDLQLRLQQAKPPLASRSSQDQRSLEHSTSPSTSVSVAIQSCIISTSSESQTEAEELTPACTDNFVWSSSCSTQAAALEDAEARLRLSDVELKECKAVAAECQQREVERQISERDTMQQLEALRALLSLEADRVCQINESSRLQISAVRAACDEEVKQLQKQRQDLELRCNNAEQQVSVLTQQNACAQDALQEALREAAAAAAIEDHVKTKLVAAQSMLQKQQVQREEELVARAQERADFQRQLLEKDELLQQAQAAAANLRERCVHLTCSRPSLTEFC